MNVHRNKHKELSWCQLSAQLCNTKLLQTSEKTDTMLHFALTPNCACEHGKTRTSNLWVFVLCCTSVSWKIDFYSKNQLGHNCGMDRLFALWRKTGTAGNTCLEWNSARCRKKKEKEMMCEFIYSKACVKQEQHVQHHCYNSYYSRAGACGTHMETFKPANTETELMVCQRTLCKRSQSYTCTHNNSHTPNYCCSPGKYARRAGPGQLAIINQ